MRRLSLGGAKFCEYANKSNTRANAAWNWAEANPQVTFFNNVPENDSQGLAAGQQEVDDEGRAAKKLAAAIYLFIATGDSRYRDIIYTQYSAAPITENHNDYQVAYIRLLSKFVQ